MVIFKTNSGFKLKTNCWNNIDIYLGEDKIQLQYNDKSNLFCSDMILWGSHNKIRFETWLLPSNKSISLEKSEINDVQLYGISFSNLSMVYFKLSIQFIKQ